MKKSTLKKILGEIPFTAEAYWYLHQAGNGRVRGFSLPSLEKMLPEWSATLTQYQSNARPGKQVMVFGVLRYWISHTTLLSMVLAGLGHRVTLVYLPYGKWYNPINRFDLRRHNLYARRVFEQITPFVKTVSLLDVKPLSQDLPSTLEEQVREVALHDTQYTLQVEEVDLTSNLYRLRLERDRSAARAAMTWLQANRPEVIIIPNGMIQEFGALNKVARYLDIPVVTYEFGEQRQRLWLAQNGEVMRQQTNPLWTARGGRGLSSAQWEKVRGLFSARQHGISFENFTRRWQGVASAGGEQARNSLGLDSRPIVLLATNVVGDSLTLGRQVFSDSMTEWLKLTIQYFAGRPDVQLVIRIHPGELNTKGPSVADLVQRTLPVIPTNIFLVPANSPVNTYDLVEIADLGLVYTTTVGMEMAMSGIPVIPVGQTHYRGKGFTLDPDTWEAFYGLLEQVLSKPEQFRLSKEQVELAWEYAYRFFFEFPHPYPWHIVRMWEDVNEWSLERVLSPEGQECFGKTFQYLVGEPVDWSIGAGKL